MLFKNAFCAGWEVEAIAKHIESKDDAIAEAHCFHEPDTNTWPFDEAAHEDDYNLLKEMAEDIRDTFGGDPAPAAKVPVGEVRFDLGAPSVIYAELYSETLPSLAPGTKLYTATQPAPGVQGEPAEQYNHKRIGWELERTAMGDGYYG